MPQLAPRPSALFGLLLLACGGAPAPASRPATPEPEPAAGYACRVESRSRAELGRATGRGSTYQEAAEDAGRQLCAAVDEECPGDDLLVWMVSPPAERDAATFEAGVDFHLWRRTYATHDARSARSRAAACEAAEEAFMSSDVPSPRGLAGIDGLRWSQLFGSDFPFPPLAESIAVAIEGLPYAHVEREAYECAISARVSVVAWRHELPGEEGEACLDARPATLPRNATRQSFTRCDPAGECHTHCAVIESEGQVEVKAVSETSYQDACAAAARRVCPDRECFARVHTIDGLDARAFGAFVPAPPPPR